MILLQTSNLLGKDRQKTNKPQNQEFSMAGERPEDFWYDLQLYIAYIQKLFCTWDTFLDFIFTNFKGNFLKNWLMQVFNFLA